MVLSSHVDELLSNKYIILKNMTTKTINAGNAAYVVLQFIPKYFLQNLSDVRYSFFSLYAASIFSLFFL